MIEYLTPRQRELSDAAAVNLVAPPCSGQSDSCRHCHTYTDRTSGVCWNCAQNHQKLGSPPVTLDMISLYQKPSQLRDWLTQYKGRTDGSEPFVEEYVEIVESLIARFLYEHGSRILDRRALNTITVVPSSSRPRPHPLESILTRLPLTIPVELLLERGPGELDFNKPSVDAFVSVPTESRRVLLVDDVCTTGARLSSAAHALTAAGHEISGALVLARRVNVGYGRSPEFWKSQTAETFDWASSPFINDGY